MDITGLSDDDLWDLYRKCQNEIDRREGKEPIEVDMIFPEELKGTEIPLKDFGQWVLRKKGIERALSMEEIAKLLNEYIT